MTKEMLWLLMGHLVCIGQWAAFIMVEYAFLGRGRRFRFPCLWAALLAAVFLVASIRHDIGFFNVESVILNVIYLLVTVLFFGGSWNQKLSACLVNGIMCLLTENTVSYTFAWCKHIPVREVWRYRSCLFLLVAAVVGAGLLAAYIIRRWRREQALTPLQMLVMSFFPGIVVVLNIVLMVSGGSEVPSMMNMMLTFGLTIAVLIHLGIVQMVNDQMLLQQTLMVEAVRQKKSAEALLKQLNDSREYPSEEAAMTEFNQAKGKWKAAEAASKEAEKKEKASSEELVNCTSLIKRFEGELPDHQKLYQERQAFYQTLMNEKNMTEAEWADIAENYTRETAELLQKEADSWQRKKLAAQTTAETAGKAIDGRSKPDMEAAKSQMEEAEKVRLQTQTKLELYKEQYKADKEAYDILSPQMEKRGKIIEKHTKLETLYKLLSGNMSGNRMDLETYVQRYYLEKILYAANRRFANMSAGQFELRMVDEENAGKGKNRGLDLMVYSNVTGKEREVRTLSGGESFMAALALALGMADQIQESSAAIHLDVMFVDEGFGSLDEHSREQAVKVLQELAGGSKLIGIISHVTELKQEIEDQLIVSKDEKGSHVKWQIS